MRLIDVDALNDAMYHEAFENNDSYDERNPMARWDSGLWIRYKMFENIIADAPTIEPKRGEWIYQFRDSENEEYRCSVCGFPQGFKPNFCPNCGAKMDGERGE